MKPFSVNFFKLGQLAQFAYRGMDAVPRVGDMVVFSDTRFVVESVEWCMDAEVCELGMRVNIELSKLGGPFRLRVCARCERLFFGANKGCPECGFGSYDAKWVYDSWWKIIWLYIFRWRRI